MSDAEGKVIWRVHSADGRPLANAFDALILTSDTTAREKLSPSRLIGSAVPFERELPDVDLTIIIRTTDATTALVSECDVRRPDGERRVYGRSRMNLAVMVCSKTGITVTGLPEPREGSNTLPGNE